MSLDVSAIPDATLGASVTGVDLSRIDDRAFGTILEAWHAHAVLVFPDQHLDDDAQVAFSRRFGELERLITNPGPGGRPEIGSLSSLRRDGTPMRPNSDQHLFLKGNTYWHTDSSFKRVPAKASCLSARQVPSRGGETSFADMRAAWDALDDALRERLETGVAVHSYWYSQSLVGGTGILTRAEWDALPPVEHPMVRTHPATGRRSLYLGRHASHVVGLPESEGRALIERVNAWAVEPPRIFTHHWAKGDVVIWDNRCVLHRGHDWPLEEPRVMNRTTIAGDADVASNEWSLDA